MEAGWEAREALLSWGNRENRYQLVLLNPVTTNPSHYLNDLKGKVKPIPQPLGTCAQGFDIHFQDKRDLTVPLVYQR